MLNFGEYLVPLSVAKRTSSTNVTLDRYAGIGFFIDANGLFITCKHVTDSVSAEEVLVATCLTTGKAGLVHGLKTHPKYDFAAAFFRDHPAPKVFPLQTNGLTIGLDVQAFGFATEGRQGSDVRIVPRLFKGHVVRLSDTSSAPGSRSTVELSFPSFKGFSGAPITTVSSVPRLAGMLFSNLESSIEVYSYSEVKTSSWIESERIHRLVELGIAHSVDDIVCFLRDLGLTCDSWGGQNRE